MEQNRKDIDTDRLWIDEEEHLVLMSEGTKDKRENKEKRNHKSCLRSSMIHSSCE